MAFPDIYLGMGFSLDYQYNYNNPHSATGENYKKVNNNKDLGFNLSLEYVLDRISFSIIFNDAIWTLGDRRKRDFLNQNRSNRPMASIGLYFGYRFEID